MRDLLEGISLEQEIVLAAAGGDVGALAGLVGQEPDWERVFSFAKEKGVLFFVYRQLKAVREQGAAVPDDFLEKLKRLYLENSTRNLWLAGRLVQIVGLLGEAGVCAVPFKGPVLAEALYGDIGIRYFTDLDILVRPEDAVRARDVLVESGFYEEAPLPETQLKIYIRHENFFKLFDHTKKINIDLHWELTARYSLCPVYLDGIRDRLEDVEVGNGNVPALGFEDRLIYLCVHSSRHNWDTLEVVCAVAEIVRAGKVLDWRRVEERAARLKCRKMVYFGLALARDLMGVVLPAEVETRVNKAWFVRYLERQVVKKIFMGQTPYAERLSWRFSTFHVLVRDHYFDGVRYGLRIFFRPTVREWIDRPLPDNWLFLYYVLRPLRIVAGGVKGVFGGR